MRLISSGPSPDEPEDGWESGPQLHDTYRIITTLCVFTGDKPTAGECTARRERQHPDTECLQPYVLTSRVRDMAVGDLSVLIADPPPEMRRPWPWA